jgi:hypothetical protein
VCFTYGIAVSSSYSTILRRLVSPTACSVKKGLRISSAILQSVRSTGRDTIIPSLCGPFIRWFSRLAPFQQARSLPSCCAGKEGGGTGRTSNATGRERLPSPDDRLSTRRSRLFCSAAYHHLYLYLIKIRHLPTGDREIFLGNIGRSGANSWTFLYRKTRAIACSLGRRLPIIKDGRGTQSLFLFCHVLQISDWNYFKDLLGSGLEKRRRRREDVICCTLMFVSSTCQTGMCADNATRACFHFL